MTLADGSENSADEREHGETRAGRRWAGPVSAGFAPVMILLLLSPTLVGDSRIAFRDLSHFYLPLYDYVAFRCDQEWLPLWNPLDHTGVPLIGESSTAVLYPIRYAVFALPWSTVRAMNWYLAIHLMVAALSAWYLGRCLRVSRPASSLAAIMYALSGSVYSLACNPPFLVGAAWLPLVLAAVLGSTALGKRRRLIIGGVSLAMMVLGGDPQSALHVCLVCLGVLVVAGAKGYCQNREAKTAFESGKVLMGAVVLAGLMSAVQISASVDWSRQSERVLSDVDKDWTSPPLSGTPAAQAMNFSLPPWHWLELATRKPFGDLFPKNQRLSQLIPGDGKMWTPTLYMGVLGLIAWLVRMGQWRRRGIDLWSAVAWVGLLLCGGHFGLVWMLQQFTDALDRIDSAIGGPYWILYQFLPGYDSFRYPTKWLPVFAIAISMVTAQWFDRVRRDADCRRESWWCVMGLAVVVVFASCVTVFLRGSATTWGKPYSQVRDYYWGPLEIAGGLTVVFWSLVASLVVLGMIAGCLRVLGPPQSEHANRRSLIACLVLILVVTMDLIVSAQTMLPHVSIRKEMLLADQASPEFPNRSLRWLRMQDGGWPDAWKESGSPLRPLEVAASERAGWFGRWHLADRQAVFNNMISIRSQSVALFWESADRSLRHPTPKSRQEFWNSVRRWLSMDGVRHCGRGTLTIPIDGESYALVQVKDFVDEYSDPIETWTTWRVAASGDLEKSMNGVIKRMVNSDGEPIPTVFSKGDAIPLPQQSDLREVSVARDEGSVVIRAQSPTLVVRPIYQDGNWRARIREVGETGSGSKSLPVYNVDGLKQGCWIPSGDWHLEFSYRPGWLIPSMILTSLGWLAMATLVVIERRHQATDIAPTDRID